MSDPYTFAMDVWFKIEETDQPDGEHYLLQWAMAENQGSGWIGLPTIGRKKGEQGDYGFGDISVNASKDDEFVVSIFTDDQQGDESGANIVKSVDWVRLVSRPAHDTIPNDKLPVSPFQGSDAEKVTQGAATDASGASNTYSAAFGRSFTMGWTSALGGKLANPPSAGAHFEIEVYIGVTNGDGVQRYYKSDPELIVGKRGG